MTNFNTMQEVKRAMYARRNGQLADTLRRSGAAPFSIIFGLNLPQIDEIATMFGHDADLARRLRENRSTRESQLLAPALMPPEAVDSAEARQWLDNSQSVEVADILCHRLLRHLPFAHTLAADILADPKSNAAARYGALRLIFNLMSMSQISADMALQTAKQFVGDPDSSISAIARRLSDEARFRSELTL